MYGFIYITTNNIDGKKYIGQRTYARKGWKTYLGSGIHIKRAIKKYGEENFSRVIIEECDTKEKLDEREKYWINHYGAVNSNNYYNIANGGDGGNTIAGYSESQLLEYKRRKSVIHKKTSLKGENSPRSKLTDKDVATISKLLMDNMSSSQDIANKFNVSLSTIDDIYNHRTWLNITDGLKFPDRKNHIQGGRNKKTVKQYDVDGNYIATYESCHDAEKITGIGFRMISRVCNGDRDHTHGYVFKYV